MSDGLAEFLRVASAIKPGDVKILSLPLAEIRGELPWVTFCGPAFSPESAVQIARVFCMTYERTAKGNMAQVLGAAPQNGGLWVGVVNYCQPPAKAAYSDARCPERKCDRCERTYRGPAVYCCFECAVADA